MLTCLITIHAYMYCTCTCTCEHALNNCYIILLYNIVSRNSVHSFCTSMILCYVVNFANKLLSYEFSMNSIIVLEILK